MVYIDQTSTFHALLASRSAEASSSGSSSTAVASSSHTIPYQRGRIDRKKRRLQLTDEQRIEQEKAKQFLKEAYQINNHISTLENLLRSVRRAYLSTATQPPRLHVNSRTSRRGGAGGVDHDEDDHTAQLRALESARYLSDREKDEVDLRAKVILKTCRERIRLMEERETARQKSSVPTPSASLLHTLLPSLSAPSNTSSSSAVLTAHRASIIYHLTSHLSRVAQTQYELQEERAKRREERGRSLGGQVAKTTAAAQAEGMTNNQPVQLTIPTLSGEDESQPTPTQEQIQQFAEENSHLLTQMSSTLTTVLSAESSILEISQLQSSLIAHLHAQSETIDRLYDDAIGTVADVEKANKELRKAKERSGEARIFLLVFLIGGSLTLLFLDWYS